MSNHYQNYGFSGTSGPIGETGFSGSSGTPVGKTGFSDSSGTVSSGLTYQTYLPILEINEILPYGEIKKPKIKVIPEWATYKHQLYE